MKPGQMRHRVVLQSRGDTELPSGEIVAGYTDLAEVWARIRPLSSREFFAAQQVSSEATTEITIRWREGVETAGRVLYTRPGTSPPEVTVYDIVSALADPIVNRRWITLLCVNRTAEGFRSGN